MHAAQLQSYLAERGVADERVLRAVADVPRAPFVDRSLVEFADEQVPLPIGANEVTPEPLVVALLAQAAGIGPADRVLEIGAGTGYGAAVLGRLAARVTTIERHEAMASQAADRLRASGSTNVAVHAGDGRTGHGPGAPYDVIVVATGDPSDGDALDDQLAPGGRIVAVEDLGQRSVRIVRRARGVDPGEAEDLGCVRLVPAPRVDRVVPHVAESRESPLVIVPAIRPRAHGLPELVREAAEPMAGLHPADLAPLVERVADADVVLLGEATHGTSEFYALRGLITRALVEHHGFTAIAVEGDWPDAARVDRFVRGRHVEDGREELFSRFPTWMWRNAEMAQVVGWLHDHNRSIDDPARRVSFHGLDLYSLYSSRAEVLRYLDRVDPDAALVARHRYSCLSPWQRDPAAYGRAVVTGRFAGCEDAVVATLTDLLRRRLGEAEASDDEFVDAAQNAVVVANAERYYRVMYAGSVPSWNLRDQHMFETLQVVRHTRGGRTKVVVWEHNSHVGDASATEMGGRGEHNVGMLCRRHYGDRARLVGFGTHRGTVAAATDWGGPMEVKSVRPSHPRSYEHVFHETTLPAFLLSFRSPRRPDVVDELSEPRLERAIGVIYRPETELASHYFEASIAAQFDEYVWIDETQAVRPVSASALVPERDR